MGGGQAAESIDGLFVAERQENHHPLALQKRPLRKDVTKKQTRD